MSDARTSTDRAATGRATTGRNAGPWIAGSLAALVMVAAVLVYVFLGLGHDNDAGAASRTFTADERGAVSAAGTEAANLISFSRAHFDTDFARALAGTTGDLKTDVEGKKAQTKKTLTDGKFDLSANVTHTALVGPVDDDKVHGYVVLVSLNGYRSTAKNQPTQQNLQVTVVKKGGKWLVDNLTSVGVGSS